MRASELKVGSQVVVDEKSYRVMQISPNRVWYAKAYSDRWECRLLCDMKPTTITEKILLNNGFKLDERLKELGLEEKYYNRRVDEHMFTIREGSNTIGRDWSLQIDDRDGCSIASADIQYVHQMQSLLNVMDIKWEVKI